MRIKRMLLLLPLLGAACVCATAKPQTPPMGFSSWNFGGGSFPREENAKAIADAMVSRGLKDAGYEYVMAFDGWWWTLDKGSRGPNGEIVPDPDRWPNGIKSVCDYIHSKGLKVAGYSDIGAQGYGDSNGRQWGSLPYYQKDADQFAEWGWDYIKIDDCFANGDRPTAQAFADFCAALHKSSGGRMCLSLSTPSTPSAPDFAPLIANMWRTSEDVNRPGWAHFARTCNLNFDSSEEFWWNQAPGRWNDIDMMVIGIKGLTDFQNKTLLNLWAIRGAPLLIGCDVRSVSQSVIDILTNPEVIAVDQDKLCAQGRKVREDKPNVQVYCKPLGSFTSGERAVLLVNRSSAPQDITVHWTDLGLCEGAFNVRDLNAKKNLGKHSKSYTAYAVGPDDSVLLSVVGKFDWSKPRDYEAEWAYNTLGGSARHRSYQNGFSSFAYVDGIGKGAENYLQFNKVAVPRSGKYTAVISYASDGQAEMVDDSDTRITYSPDWKVWKEAGYYGESTHCSSTGGAWCEFEFTGDSISWVCKTSSNRGIAEVYIDGKLDATIDCYGVPGDIRKEVYTKSRLSSGRHTIRIVAIGRKNAASSDTMLDIDGFRVFNNGQGFTPVMMSVNGGKPVPLHMPSTQDTRAVANMSVDTRLQAGENTIRLLHDTQLLPIIDKLTILGSKPPIQNSVSFKGIDSETGREWKGTYGNLAYCVYGGPANVPSNLALRYRHGDWNYYANQGGDSAGLTVKSPSDSKGLLKQGSQDSASFISRADNFTIEIDAKDGETRQVAFYAVDWDMKRRVVKIEAYDGVTNTLKDVRAIRYSENGQYVVYKITGRTKFKFSRLVGPDVSLHGIFIDTWKTDGIQKSNAAPGFTVNNRVFPIAKR